MRQLPKALLMASVAIFVTTGTATLIQSSPAYAAEKKEDHQKTRHLQSLSQSVYEAINKANKALEAKMYDEAIKLASDVLKRKNLNQYEQVVAYQVLGYAEYSKGDNDGVIKAFQKIIEIAKNSDGLPEGTLQSTQYNLAQMYIGQESYDKGIALLKEWFTTADNPAPDAYILLGSAYAQKNDYKEAIPYMKQGIEVAEKEKKEVQQSWYQNLASMYLLTNQYKKAEPILELMVMKWPTQQYLVNLAQVYGMEKREKDMMGIMDALYRKGLFTKGDEILQLSQLWQYHDAPYRGAVILEKGIKDGMVKKTAKNYESLANAYIGADEVDKAIPYLTKAAELSADGKIYLRLGEAYIQNQKWSGASDALENALKKGGLDNKGQAYYLRGIAQYNMNDLNSAKKSFALCRDDKKMSKNCDSYLQLIRRKEKSQS